MLSTSQSGFRHGHSTDTAVICVSDFILKELGVGKYVGAVLVDLKKAFDTVDHKILLKKLFCYGFRDVSLDWFESYLSDKSNIKSQTCVAKFNKKDKNTFFDHVISPSSLEKVLEEDEIS